MFKPLHQIDRDKKLFTAEWSIFVVVTVSNNFPYKAIILESYRLLPIYTSRISLLSKLEILKVNNFLMGIQKTQTKLHPGNV